MSGASQINPNVLELAIWHVIWERAQDLGQTRASLGKAMGKTGQQVGRYITGERVAPLTQVEDAAKAVGLTLLGVVREAEKVRDAREAEMPPEASEEPMIPASVTPEGSSITPRRTDA